jgi:molecular chaperone DnaJ
MRRPCYRRSVSQPDDEKVRQPGSANDATATKDGEPAPAQGQGFTNVEDIFAQFGDLFGEFFGNAGGHGGADLRVSLELSADDARVGVKRDVEVMRAHVCSECAGAGGFGEASTCKDCSGAGKRNVQQGFFMVQSVCGTCGGAGKRWKKPCVACERGLVRSAEKLSVSVPAGIEHGQMLRIAGKGNELAGKPAGHLYVAIAIEGHEDAGTPPKLGKPRDRGPDVVVDVAVRARHLLLGGSLEVPTPDGSATVRVPRGVEDGHEIRLAGRGKSRAARAPEAAAGDPYRDVTRGDLVVVLRVPPEVQKQREAIGFAALISVVLAILVALSLR